MADLDRKELIQLIAVAKSNLNLTGLDLSYLDLKKLDLRNNQLSALPAEIANLINLQILFSISIMCPHCI